MTTMRITHLAAVLLVSSLAAQSYVVSPAAFTDYRGTSNNTFPLWWSNARYQQIHGDLQGTPRVLQGMSFRRSQFSAVARTITVTINLGDSSYAARSTTFASNFTGTPTTVFPTGTVNLPDWTSSSGNIPEPWTAHFPYTTPFPYAATSDLCWEFLVTGNTATSSYPTDAYSNSTTMYAGLSQLGTGCRVGSNTLPFTQTMNVTTSSSTNNLSFGGSVVRGPASTGAVTMVGVVNLDATIPGLCEKLFPLTVWTFGFTLSSSGSGTMPTLVTTHDPNWAGLVVYAQTVALDSGQPGIPVALTNGTAVTLPPFAPGPINICRVYNSSSSSATTGTLGSNYGLITRFTH